jgi:SpoVK/Ycf46/Vps4 family AAA+-type ATPase
MEDFLAAIKNVRPSVPPESLAKYEKWMTLQGSG